jgi:hypothetical protein
MALGKLKRKSREARRRNRGISPGSPWIVVASTVEGCRRNGGVIAPCRPIADFSTRSAFFRPARLRRQVPRPPAPHGTPADARTHWSQTGSVTVRGAISGRLRHRLINLFRSQEDCCQGRHDASSVDRQRQGRSGVVWQVRDDVRVRSTEGIVEGLGLSADRLGERLRGRTPRGTSVMVRFL